MKVKKIKSNFKELPIEIKNNILNYLNLDCHVCKKKLNNFFNLANIYKTHKNIFCSIECYNHI